MEMESRYDPSQYEDAIYKRWEESGYFRAPEGTDREHYSIVIPPPNVTGALHMGHALNNSIQDILIRYYRQQGKAVLWMPGTDHAGIATQHVVEKELLKEGTSRREIGREAFVERVWEWRKQYGGRIISQLKRLGCSCDWERERFTLDEGLSRAVKHVFVKLFESGLVYRGEYLINWCPGCRTALSDDEVRPTDESGHLWDLKYPLKDSDGHIIVATTRPETMLGDTAVAVNPKDERYADLVGKTVVLPLVDREIPIIADEFVDMEFGSGAVKVTPAHDPNDFEIGRRHGLEFINILNEDGTINENGGPYKGLDRYEARKKIIADLEARGLYCGECSHEHAVGHCYRCKNAVEPYISTQWFVKMRPLAAPAIKAVKDGSVAFVPKRYENIYFDWLENVRDWCISRQLWWGHRIPVFYCENGHTFASEEDEPDACPECGSKNYKQDEDVLDTWFSSQLWPFSTMGYPDDTRLLEEYYPTNVLVTDRGIIYFWVARMVMMGLEFMQEKPFHHVYIHGTILDEIGRPMSKSLGNGIDPIEMIEQYGADAVRFSLIMLSSEGQDLKLSPTKFEMGRNFANKLWNASRFVMSNLEGYDAVEADACGLKAEDEWIYTLLGELIEEVAENILLYKFNAAITAIYNFTWNSFCDWYLEIIKARLNSGDLPSKCLAQKTAASVLDNILRLLHPYMPYITEELWVRLRGLIDCGNGMADTDTLMYAAPAEAGKLPRNDRMRRTMDSLIEVVRRVRNIRGEYKIASKKQLEKVIFSSSFKSELTPIREHDGFIKMMANIGALEIGSIDRPPHSAVSVHGKIQIYVPLEGIVDLDAERKRLQKDIDKTSSGLERIAHKLTNRAFLEKAPAEVIEREKNMQADLAAKLEQLEDNLKALQ